MHELGGLLGQTFDQRYAQLEMAHVLVGNANAREELRYGTNAAVQAYARQLLSVLGLHLRLANELSRTSH